MTDHQVPTPLPIPSVHGFRLADNLLVRGTPVLYAYKDNTHLFNALVQDCGSFLLALTNGHQTAFVEVTQILDGEIEIHLLSNYDAPLILPCHLFDVEGIPPGSIFIDQDGTSFIVTEVEPFSLSLSDHQNETHYINAETFFELDKGEVDNCQLVVPPVLTAGPEYDGEIEVTDDNPR